VPSRLAFATLAAAGVVGLASPIWAPPALRNVDWFSIRSVEVSGARLLEPHEVLSAADVHQGDNLWMDLGPIASAIRRHPTVESVTVSRRPPHTLRIRVEEKRPIAYVEVGSLAPITARGEILPVDPTRARLDLPLIRGAWEELDPAVRATVLGVTEAVRRGDPELLSQISEIRGASGDPVAVHLIHAAAEIVLPGSIDGRRLSQLRAVLLDLERRFPPADPTGAAPRVDVRFDEQIVVRLPSPVS
jgi:cell division protein FtsQ